MISEQELRELCGHLQHIEQRGSLSESERDALRRAAFALWVVFFNGLMDEVEQLRRQGDLTIEQRKHLESLGIGPDADSVE